MTASDQSATLSQIAEIVGPLDDAVLVEILATGATPAEIVEALTWANADDEIGTEKEQGPRETVLHVYEILVREERQPEGP
jgi:hypothetical protein